MKITVWQNFYVISYNPHMLTLEVGIIFPIF